MCAQMILARVAAAKADSAVGAAQHVTDPSLKLALSELALASNAATTRAAAGQADLAQQMRHGQAVSYHRHDQLMQMQQVRVSCFFFLDFKLLI